MGSANMAAMLQISDISCTCQWAVLVQPAKVGIAFPSVLIVLRKTIKLILFLMLNNATIKYQTGLYLILFNKAGWRQYNKPVR